MKAGVYRRPEVDPQLGRLISGKQDKEGLQSNYLPFAICLTAAVFFAALFHTFPQIDVQQAADHLLNSISILGAAE